MGHMFAHVMYVPEKGEGQRLLSSPGELAALDILDDFPSVFRSHLLEVLTSSVWPL
mgnify:CR=1 FL=1